MPKKGWRNHQQILGMIHRVSARRIVYRDLKPENVSSSDDEHDETDG